ncbi:hypothetical protein [Desulfosporosinus fructosivorans]
MKKVTYFLACIILTLSLAGCGSTSKASTDQKSPEQSTVKSDIKSAEVFAEKHMKETSLIQWDQLYTSLHPDIQAKYSKEQYVASGKENEEQVIASLKDYKIGTAIILSTWTDPGMGAEYKDVAEVPITYNYKDGSSENGNMHLAKDPEGNWRWFWSPPEASQTIPSRQVDFGQEGDLGQFGFKVLTAENTKEAKTPSKSISVTSNTYEIVKVEVTNKRSAPAELGDFEIRLFDIGTKAIYNLNSKVTIDMAGSFEIYDKQPAVYLYDAMNPGLKNEFTTVFEVPTDANYALVVTYKNDGMMLKLK